MTHSFVAALVFGLGIGLSAGLAPGPLSTLVLTSTLSSGTGAGIRVACAPLLTDAPIIAASVLLVGQAADSNHLLGVIGVLGGAYLLWLGAQTAMVETMLGETDSATAGNALRTGIVANLLNPHPYLFWIAIGAPYLIRSNAASATAAIGFLAGFYVTLVGSKVVAALLVGRYRHLLSGVAYRRIMTTLGVLLEIFGVLLIHDGIALATPS